MKELIENPLKDTHNLEQARTKIKEEIAQLRTERDSTTIQVQNLISEKKKLDLENRFLKEATDSVLELREHSIGVPEIVKIRSLAQKYRSPSGILEALDTYKSLREMNDQKTELKATIDELSKREITIRTNVKTVQDELATLPSLVHKSTEEMRSALGDFAKQIQDLGDSTKKASKDVEGLKMTALAAGRDLAAIESQVKLYTVTHKLIEFMTKGKGEDADVVMFATSFLNRLSQWAENIPKYKETTGQIGALREYMERQLVHG